MNGRFAAILLTAKSATSLASCGEKLQIFVPTEQHADPKTESWKNQMRERTLNQGEDYRSSR